MSEKRYFWMKLHEDFFDEKYIRALRRLPQGDSLVIVYLKMQLKTLKTEGIFHFENIMPDCASELSLAIDEDENVTKLALDALVRFGAIERMDNDDLFFLAMQKSIGSEGSSAKRMRELREKQKQALSQCDETPSLCCGETEKETEKEKSESDKSTPAPDFLAFGTSRKVKLTQLQFDRLCDDFGRETAERYIERLDYDLDTTGKSRRNHDRVIRKWISEDSKSDTVTPDTPVTVQPKVSEEEYNAFYAAQEAERGCGL